MPIYCAAVNCSSKSDSTILSFFSLPEGHIPVSGTYKISLSDALHGVRCSAPSFASARPLSPAGLRASHPSAPSISLPFFPLPIGLVQNAGRGGIAGRDRTHVQNAGVRDPFHGLSALYQRYAGQVAAPPDCMVFAGRGTTRLVVNHSVANRPIGTVVQLQPKRVTGSALMVAWAV